MKQIVARWIFQLMTAGIALSVSLPGIGSVVPSQNTNHILGNPVVVDQSNITWDGVWFGEYWQNDYYGKTKEPILWRVLSVNGNDAMLVAEHNLAAKRYMEGQYDPDKITWKNSTIRSWLGSYSTEDNFAKLDFSKEETGFLKTAFTPEERDSILPVRYTEGAESVTDQVTLLSKSDVENKEYGFGSNGGFDCSDTRYLDVAENVASNTCLLRSSYSTNLAYYMANSSNSYMGMREFGYETGIRPVIHIDLSKKKQWQYAGRIGKGGVLNETDSEYTPTPVKVPIPNSDGVTVVNGVATGYTGSYRYISIPEGVKAIADNFQTNVSLVRLYLPSSLVTIGANAFSEKKKLELVSYTGQGLTEIKSKAFFGCESLKTFSLPSKLVTIGDYAFQRCTNLPNQTFPATLKSIGISAFANCTSLSEVILNEGLETLGTNAFGSSGSTEATKIEIPGSLKTISSSAFYGWTYVPKVIIHEGVNKIGDAAFSSCYILEDINLPDTLVQMDERVFERCYALKSVSIPEKVTFLGKGIFNSCRELTSVKLPTGLTAIPEEMFWQCKSLTSLEWPIKVTAIGPRAFGYTAFSKVTIPDTVDSIGAGAFSYISALNQITFSEKTSQYGYGIMYGCGMITKVKLPSSMTNIPDSMFEKCSRLQSIKFSDQLVSIGKSAFADGVMLEFLDLSNSKVTSIGESAFAGSGLKYFKVPERVTSIADNTFKNCTNLVRLDMNSQLQTIGKYALYNTGLVGLRIPDNVNSIGDYAISNCLLLEGVALPDSLVMLGRNFSECTKLAQVILPEKVTAIKAYTFYSFFIKNHVNQVIIVKGKVDQVEESAFANMYQKTTLYGLKGSALEEYAIKKGIAFYPLTEAPTTQEVVLADIPKNEGDDLVVKVSDEDCNYFYDGNSIEIRSSGTYYISMKEGVTKTQDIICVNLNKGEVNIVLDHVNIQAYDLTAYGYFGSDPGMAGLWIATNSAANVNIILRGKSTLSGSYNYPGVMKYGVLDSVGTLTFQSDSVEREVGSLDASGFNTVGIGSYKGNDAIDLRTRNIVIKSGHITSNGIGSSTAKNIIIEGGYVETTGFPLDGEKIQITGGCIVASQIGPFTQEGGILKVGQLLNPEEITYLKGSLASEKVITVNKENVKQELLVVSECANVKSVFVDGQDWAIQENYPLDNQLYLYVTKENHKIRLATDKGETTYNAVWNGKRFVISDMIPPTIPAEYQTWINKLSYDEIKPQYFISEPVEPLAKIMDQDYELVLNQDYTVKYENNTAPGWAKLTVYGVGYYRGSYVISFQLLAKPSITPTPTPSVTPVPTAIPTYKVTFFVNGGSFKNPNQPTVLNIRKGMRVAKPADPVKASYLFGGWYYNNNLYNFNELIKKNIELIGHWKGVTAPVAPVITMSAAKAILKIGISRPATLVNGYHIQYATNSTFSKNLKTAAVVGKQSASFAVKKGKTYYVRVKAYSLDSIGKYFYSSFSKVKKIKVG